MKIAVHWFRADLRISDNTALHAACRDSDVVVPVFIFDPVILNAPDTGAPIVGFMLECLSSLEKNIEVAGGKLTFRHGPVAEEMRAVFTETKATHLYYNRDYEPEARKRDAAVEKLARSLSVEVHSYKDSVIHEPDEISKEDGTPFRVFTPFSRIWRRKPKNEVLPKARFKADKGFNYPRGIGLPTAKELGFNLKISLPSAGERAGQEQLKAFTQGDLLEYADKRDFPALNATSRLSPHLRLGTLSPRTVLAAVEKAGGGKPETGKQLETYVTELIWREFYRHVLWHFPHVAKSCFQEKYDELKWQNDERFFKAWCDGRTGFPIVDAGMRQLNSTGWMHNRVRMITAMFLTKDLLVNWQWGERYFMQKLIDADLASNNGGWQWSAGTGTDAQPYFRIFNPMAQAQKFDPGGVYIRRYVPDADTLAYPAPIVDHACQRVKALALYKR